MYLRGVLFLLFIAALQAPLHGQKKIILTLEESLSLALKQGYAVQNANSQYLVSKKTYEASLRKLRTSVSLDVDLPRFSESLTSQFNPLTEKYEFYQLKTTSVQTGLTVTQPFVYTGGTLTLREILFRRDQVSGLTGFSRSERDFFNNILVEFRQPLLTPNTQRISSDKASLGLEQAEADFVKNQLDLMYTTTESFYSLYQLTQRYEIVKEQAKQNQESYETAKNKFSAGLIPEVEVLQSEVDLISSQNEVLSTQRELERSKNSFRLLVGISSEEDIELRATLTYHPVAIDSARAIELALQKRSEVANAERNKQIREMDVDLASSRSDFRMDLTATYGFNRYDTELSKVFRDFGKTRSATLSISVPVFDWGSNSLEVEAAAVQHQNSIATYEYVRQQIQQEILDLLSRIKLAESKIHVQEKVVEVAQKSYDISLSRFRSGIISRNDLSQAQQRLTTAKINTLAALIDYRIGLADLKRKTLFDFETNEAVRPASVE